MNESTLIAKPRVLSLAELEQPAQVEPTNEPDKAPGKIYTIIPLLMAFSLFANFVTFFLYASSVMEEASFLILVAPIFLSLILKLPDMQVALRRFRVALIYLIPQWISYVANIAEPSVNPVSDGIILVNITFAFLFAAIAGSFKGRVVWRDVMYWLAILALPAFLYVLRARQADMIWGRWNPYNLQPNWWGMMALGLIWCCLETRNLVVKVVGIAVACLFLFKVQSRGSMVALVPLFIPYIRELMAFRTKYVVGFFVLCFVATVLVFTVPGVSAKFNDFVVNDIMLLHDKYRGENSGLTGRTKAYEKAIDAFTHAPVLGSGFGAFEFVHNGFLLVMAESGIVGLLGFLTLLGNGIYTYAKRGQWNCVGYILSYIIAIQTYPRSINLNMTSLLLIFIIMYSFSENWRAKPFDNSALANS